MWIELILVGVVSLLLYKFLKPSKPFWEEYGVPQINNSGFKDKLQIFLGKKTMSDTDDIAYEKLGSTGKFCGLVEMTLPILLVKDLEIAKKILIKDFDHFVDRRTFAAGQKEKLISRMVGTLEGDEWKEVRAALSPTFTTGKIRRMMTGFNNVSNEWVDHLKKEISNSNEGKHAVNIQKEATNFTVDAIAATVFGMKAETIHNPESIFAKMVARLSEFSVLSLIKFGLATNFPGLVRRLGISVMDGEALGFFERILSQGMKARMEGTVKMNDFIQLVIEARKGELKAEGSDEMSSFEKEAQLFDEAAGKKNPLHDDDTAIAQAISFFFAGFSTVSNFIGFVLYLLALNPEIQSKLRDEVNSKLFGAGGSKNIDYDEVNKLVYLDMVICEVLRKYPPLGRLERRCVKEYHDPSENLRVPKGAMVCIPIQAIHNDKQYYECPDKFYPEHFTPENKAKRNPYAFLAFGSGPRNCIGMRFALVESKAAIAHLVHNFVIEPTGKTPVPAEVRPAGFGVAIPKDLELGFKLAC